MVAVRPVKFLDPGVAAGVASASGTSGDQQVGVGGARPSSAAVGKVAEHDGVGGRVEWPRVAADGDAPVAEVDVGQELTGQGFVGGGDQHADALQLQLRVLSSGIVGRHRRAQPVTAQQADDQFRRASGPPWLGPGMSRHPGDPERLG
jgi:hypothetical protein